MVPVASQNHMFTPIAPAPPTVKLVPQYHMKQIQPVKPSKFVLNTLCMCVCV